MSMVVTQKGEFSMLKYYHPLKINVFKKNCLAKILELEAIRLKSQDYQVAYAKQILNNIAYFGDWLKKNGICVKSIDKEIIREEEAIFATKSICCGKKQD